MFFIKSLKRQPARKILLVSIQKSGTHLIQRVMKQAGFAGKGVGKECRLSHFNGLSDDQYLWTHFTPSDEVQKAIEEGNEQIYIIFNYRDPRDVLASWFHWLHPKTEKNMHAHQSYMKKVYSAFSDDELIKIFIKIDKFREVEYNPLEHFRYARVLLFHPRILKIRFEDLVGSKGGGSDEKQMETVRSLLSYLDLDVAESESIARSAFDSKSETFRKGQIGGYKELFSFDHLKMFNQLHGEIIRQYGYTPDNY
jgi:hypothetical protein